MIPVTADDIRKRIIIIRRTREELCNKGYRSNHIRDFNKKQAKITKLSDREGALLKRLNQLIK